MSSYKLNRSNGLSKSSSQPNYLIPYELNDYNKVYLPLIKINQQAEILSNKIDKTNRIKDEILASKYKLYNNRGINNNYNYYRNKFKDSWDNFYKRKEREKRRKRIYKIIKDEPYYISSEEENDDEIFRKGMLNKIEDKIKLKQYLPAKRDLAKLMFRVNDNINERIDKNSYLLSKNIIELEKGYGELKDMIQNKINKLERKQEEDFYDLRLYFKRRAQREKDKFDNNKLILENGNDVYQVNNNIEDNYNYKANMKDNIEKLQTYEITKRIQNIPNLFDNAIKNIERIRMQRKKEKNDFLLHISNQINDYNENIYEDIDDDLIGERQKYNNYNDYAYNLDNYNDSFMGYEDTFLTGSSQNYYINKYSKPRTDYKRNSKKDMLSMSKSNVLSLKKNLKPLSYQSQKKNKMNLNDNDDSLTASDLKEIYNWETEIISLICEVPSKNIKRWLKFGYIRKKGGGRKCKNPNLETNLINWINKSINNNFFPNSSDIRKKALELASDVSFLASKTWLEKFKRKYNIIYIPKKDCILIEKIGYKEWRKIKNLNN